VAIFLDVQMPGKSGLEVAKELRASSIDSCIIGCSGFSGEAEKAECLAAGMDMYLVKPVRVA
jgi:CheY-like chemotaxis protein